ncbi:MAG: penicillin-binding protein 2 [Candidatus Pacebacteria bacterium]|nr:penicillin-binding protein 2 [Candidatus Paceibacterota bacterium]
MLEFQVSKNIKKRRISFAYQNDIEPHEALLDKLAQRKEEEFGLTGKKFEVPLSKKVLIGFLIGSLSLFLFLFLKTAQLQILEGKKYSMLSQKNKFINSQIQAERGVIYDKNLNQLVFNVPAFDLIFNKANFPEDGAEKNRIIAEVSQIIGESIENVEEKIENNENPVLENIPHQVLIVLETKMDDLLGFEIRKDWVREYKDSENFSHLLGYLGKITAAELKDSNYTVFDWVGRAGIEKKYEDFLKKDPGELQIERDALGNEISREIISQPESGKSLVLWVDSGLQNKITEALKTILREKGLKNAAAVALDPKTGGILSMVSLPSYDNNLFNKGSNADELLSLLSNPNEPLYNLAIGGQFPSGSTIKPLIASAALQEKIISPNKKINDSKGNIEIPNPWDPDSPTIKGDWTIHGLTDMRKALAESCNVYFYTIGGGYGDQNGLGITKIKKYLELFGWGKKTNIDLPGEVDGFLPTPEWKKTKTGNDWLLGDTYNVSIGQGDVLVTPLQMAASFLPIVNGGKLLEPQVVQKIVDSKKNTIESFGTKIIRENFIDPENLEIVREGMRQGVTGENSPHASSVTLNTLPVAAAAKTGTAETGKVINGERIYNHWITVFAPYDDPQIVLTIVFKDVKGLGGTTLPAAKEILQWYFTEGGGASK